MEIGSSPGQKTPVSFFPVLSSAFIFGHSGGDCSSYNEGGGRVLSPHHFM